jgi:hypothetical protein
MMYSMYTTGEGQQRQKKEQVANSTCCRPTAGLSHFIEAHGLAGRQKAGTIAALRARHWCARRPLPTLGEEPKKARLKCTPGHCVGMRKSRASR